MDGDMENKPEAMDPAMEPAMMEPEAKPEDKPEDKPEEMEAKPEDPPADDDKEAGEGTALLAAGAAAAADPESQSTKASDEDEDETCNCCCCDCACSTRKTKDLSCWGCFPIACGVVSVGIAIIALTLYTFVETFYMLMNDNIHWWYVVVAVVLMVPEFIACTFFVTFFSDNTSATRGRLDVACYLTIITIVLMECWNLTYFLVWYKSNTIVWGAQEFGFHQTKKQFLFWSLFWSAIIIAFLGYDVCLTRRYWHALKGKDDDKKADDKAAEKATEGKMD